MLKSTRSWVPTVATKSWKPISEPNLFFFQRSEGSSPVVPPQGEAGWRLVLLLKYQKPGSSVGLLSGIICSFQHKVFIVFEGYISGSLLQLSNFRLWTLSGGFLLAARAVSPHRQWLALSLCSKTEWSKGDKTKNCDSNQRRAPHIIHIFIQFAMFLGFITCNFWHVLLAIKQ